MNASHRTRGGQPLYLAALTFWGLLLALPAWAETPQTRPFNHDSQALARAEQMARSVTIYRDRYGVPHVYGPTDAACIFGFVYAQAEDYFWQVEDGFLRSLGRAAEAHGETELANDLINHALDIQGLARQEYAQANPRSREFYQAMADGLNYYLATHPEVQPRVIQHFEPWHSLALGRFLLYQSFIYRKSGLNASEMLTASRA